MGKRNRCTDARVCLFPFFSFFFFSFISFTQFTVERAANKWPSTILGQNWQANTLQRMQISRTIRQSRRWARRDSGRRRDTLIDNHLLSGHPARWPSSFILLSSSSRAFALGCPSDSVWISLFLRSFASLLTRSFNDKGRGAIKTPSVDILTLSRPTRFKFDTPSIRRNVLFTAHNASRNHLLRGRKSGREKINLGDR